MGKLFFSVREDIVKLYVIVNVYIDIGCLFVIVS